MSMPIRQTTFVVGKGPRWIETPGEEPRDGRVFLQPDTAWPVDQWGALESARVFEFRAEAMAAKEDHGGDAVYVRKPDLISTF